MQTTLDLLAEAEDKQDLTQWASELGLSAKALYNAKYRGHLSPAIAGAVAEKLNRDVDRWMVVAALESEKDSACKTRMLKRVASGARALYLSAISATRRVVGVRVHNTKHGTPRNAR